MGLDQVEPEDGTCCYSCGHRRLERRSVKRKVEEVAEAAVARVEAEDEVAEAAVARVEAEDEVASLREVVEAREEMVARLCAELEEERAASASAASEAMGMILRLQREKGEAQLEARQFRQFAEEKMAHDGEELLALEDLLYEREQAILVLSNEVQAYRDRLLSCGIALDSLVPAAEAATLEGGDSNGLSSLALPAAGHMEELEWSATRCSPLDETGKGVVMGQSTQVLAGQPMCNGEQQEGFHSSDCGGDDDNTSDRVYTVDAVHSGAAPVAGIEEDYVSITKELVFRVDGSCGEDGVDIRNLDIRLQALEADRESMRQAIVSMQADKAQLLLLKEISQQLSRDTSAHSACPSERRLVKRPFLLWCFSFISMIKATITTPFLGRFSFMSTVKWIMSFVFWKKKTNRSKYTFGLSNNNVGLFLLLDNAPRIQLRRH